MKITRTQDEILVEGGTQSEHDALVLRLRKTGRTLPVICCMGKHGANSSADRWQTRRWAIEAIVMQLCLRELIDGWMARTRAAKMYDERTGT